MEQWGQEFRNKVVFYFLIVWKPEQKKTEFSPEYPESLPVILSCMKFCVARTFLVELHLDVGLEVFLVVGLKFVDKYHRKIH